MDIQFFDPREEVEADTERYASEEETDDEKDESVDAEHVRKRTESHGRNFEVDFACRCGYAGRGEGEEGKQESSDIFH